MVVAMMVMTNESMDHSTNETTAMTVMMMMVVHNYHLEAYYRLNGPAYWAIYTRCVHQSHVRRIHTFEEGFPCRPITAAKNKRA
ncbi:hypothetical protein Y032_0070g473 [Ancylostoma ceylanicum]|nr:hypothetical protein Y032_0070g473 [Ancylostoma ceylanicum]